jgi:hypothetical protein
MHAFIQIMQSFMSFPETCIKSYLTNKMQQSYKRFYKLLISVVKLAGLA